MYVLKNNTGFFIKRNKNGGIEKTSNYKKAEKFGTYNQAKSLMRKASAKTSGYYIYEESQLDENGVVVNNESFVIPEKRRPISSDIKYELYMRQKGICCYCGQYVTLSEATIDHIIPLCKGGKNEKSNFQCTCKKCNQLKASWNEDDFLNQITLIAKNKKMLASPIEQPEFVRKIASCEVSDLGFFHELKILIQRYILKKNTRNTDISEA